MSKKHGSKSPSQSPSLKNLNKLSKQLDKCGFVEEAMAVRTVEAGGGLESPEAASLLGLRAYGSAAGINVSEQAAQNISTFYACVTLRAQTLASMPISCYRLSGPDKLDKEVADQHPAHWIWKDSPDNGFLTSFNAREAASGHVDIRGNAYWEIGRNFRGQAMRAWLLDPRRMNIILPFGYNASDTAKQNPAAGIYQYSEPSQPLLTFDRSEVMHLANFSFDGLIGIPPLTLFRETLGLTIAANDYTASYFKKGGRPLGFLTKPNVITKAQRDSLRGEWQELHGGADNSHNVGILSGGLDWKNIGLTNNDAQLLGLRQFQRYLVAELMRVPPFLLGDVEQTLTSLEFVQLQFIIFTMLPIMRRWEQEMNRVMFTPKEKFTYFMEHDPEAMLRGDQKTMAEVDQTLIRNGITLINEARRRRNRKGVEYGDTPLVMASQMATLKDVATGVANLKTTTPGADKSAQPDTPTAKYVNRITKAYKNLDEVNRKKVLGMLVSMNGVGTHPLQT